MKLTVYFGERDRAGGMFLADALTEIYGRHELQTSLVMRGVAGFGVEHHLRTDRLLTLSEDLPLVSVAVDERGRIEAARTEVEAIDFDGLVTLERATMLSRRIETYELPQDFSDEAKLTVYLGRHERLGGRPAYEAVVDLLHGRGVAGATVLLGVDGTAHGVRQRARFFASNAKVPVMVIAVGDGELIAGLVPELASSLVRPLLTLERVRVCKRDGHRLAGPQYLPPTDQSGLAVWQKLMIYASEQARAGGQPLHHQLVRSLRAAGAAGATSLRGIWGYHGDHSPHGDSLWQLRRRVPVVTIVVDKPERIREWFELIDDLTNETGLVTSEFVPAFRATGPGVGLGGLALADLGSRKRRTD
jgi:PII-like signaling protein